MFGIQMDECAASHRMKWSEFRVFQRIGRSRAISMKAKLKE